MAQIGYTLTAKLIEILVTEAVNEICRVWNYEKELQKLEENLCIIQQIFLDADAVSDKLTSQQKVHIRNLKDAVYDAEDVFDEFYTRAQLKQLGKKSKVEEFFRKVRAIFNCCDVNQNPVFYAREVAHRVKDIKKKLDDINSNYKQFTLKLPKKDIGITSDHETISDIRNDIQIIGREHDKFKIIRELNKDNIQVVTIVGMGGLGKTTLAQLVYNDEIIQQQFAKRVWVCVSDQQGRPFDVKKILCNILDLLVSPDKVDISSSSQLQLVKTLFVEKLNKLNSEKQKCLLVLDDVWNEDHTKWEQLEGIILSIGGVMNKVIVTTRSEKTTQRIINKENQIYIHKLKGLSDADSKDLFNSLAFGNREKNSMLLNIAKNIVNKCHGNPLALKSIGSFLYTVVDDRQKWELAEKSALADIRDDGDDILPILKYSYNNLKPSLKSCFSYCAIFPKGVDVDKDQLLSFWVSQGYIVPSNRGRSVEDDAEYNFKILLYRCFFHDVKIDKYNNIISVKIHDLLHDIAKEVAKEEICIVTSRVSSTLGEKIRHVNSIAEGSSNLSLGNNKIRSFICNDGARDLWDEKKQVINNWTTLRVLDLGYLGFKSLSHSIQRLLLLRYLKLEDQNLEEVSDSITSLYNLQTLILVCEKLRELPKNFSKLVNLVHMDVSRCSKLIDMPLGMDKLTKLRILPYYVVGVNSELKVLQHLTEIKGKMRIQVRNDYSGGINGEERRYLKRMNYLTVLVVQFEWEGECKNVGDVLKNLEPPRTLKELNLSEYKGITIPWLTFSRPHVHHLVDISIEKCPNLKKLFALSILLHLKSLSLSRLDNLEFLEDDMTHINNDDSEFFPSLEFVRINQMDKLKSWWKGEFPGMRLKFPRLLFLEIFSCPNLTSFVQNKSQQSSLEHEFPILDTLSISNCSSLVWKINCPTLVRLDLTNAGESLPVPSVFSQNNTVNLRDVRISNVRDLASIPPNCLTYLHLSFDTVSSLSDATEAFQRCASTLRSLKLTNCDSLRNLKGLEQLTALNELSINSSHELCIREEDEEPWRSLQQTLLRLELYYLPKMTGLPKGLRHLIFLQSFHMDSLCWLDNEGLPEWMGCLSSLRTLEILNCPNLKLLPETMRDLGSLNKLSIKGCPELATRCKPGGEDFHKIRHIRKRQILEDCVEEFEEDSVEEFEEGCEEDFEEDFEEEIEEDFH